MILVEKDRKKNYKNNSGPYIMSILSHSFLNKRLLFKSSNNAEKARHLSEYTKKRLDKKYVIGCKVWF